MNEDTTRIRIVKSKCMADMLVWLGFEYKKTDEGHIFQRSSKFDLAWRDVHVLGQRYRNRTLEERKEKH